MSNNNCWAEGFGLGHHDTLDMLSLCSDWVGILNERCELLWVNPAWASGLGIPIEQITGRIFDDLIHASEPRLPVLQHDTNIQELTLAMRDARGDAIPVHWRLMRRNDTLYLIGHVLNLPTAEPTDPHRTTFELAPVGIVHVDMDGRWLRANRRVCEQVGYTEAELLTLTFHELTLPEDFAKYTEIMLRLVSGETTVEEADFIHILKDGSHRWMHLTGTLIRDNNGAPDYFALTLENTQSRKQMEKALRDSQIRYRMVADYTYDWEYWQRPDGLYEYISPSVERITGYSPAEFEADPELLDKLVLPEDLDIIRYPYDDRNPPPRLAYEFRLRHKSGEVRWIEHICVPIYADGQYLGRRASNRDITERKQAECDLEHQRHLLEAVFHAAPGYFYVLDVDTGQHVLSNRVPGGLPAALDGPISANSVTAAMHPDDLAQLPDHRKQEEHLPEGEGYNFEFRIKNGVGGWDWIRAHEVVFKRHPDGSIHQILGIANNVTPEKEQDTALRESEALFRHMFERHQAVKLLIDPTTGHIVDANPAAAKYYGWDVATLRTMRIQDINTLPPDQVSAEMQRAAAEQRDFFNFRHRLASGEIRDVEVHSAPVEVGGKVQLHSIIMDVTELHRAQRELQESRNRFDAFMRNSPMAAYIKDLEGRLIYLNPVSERVFGLENVEWLNKTDVALWGDNTPVRDTDKHNLVMGMTTIAEKTVTIAGGPRVWLTHTFPIQDVQGQLFVGGMGVDITEMKHAEEQLIAMALERERMQILGRFIEKATHEFRTPLSIIELGLHAIRGLSDDARHVRRINQMEDQVFYITELVDSMTTMTRLDSLTRFDTMPVSIQSLLRNTRDRFVLRYPSRAEGVTLHLAETPLNVAGDTIWLEKAIIELLTNAHQFTPDGGQVSIHAAAYDDQAVIEVRDTGVGITPDHQRHIFEHFFRADVAHTTRGFGLGLAMVKRVVELHGGVLEFESTQGVGSMFRISLPLV